MPTFETLSSVALASVLFGIVLGILLVVAVELALKIWTPLNAATRVVIWSALLIALPLIPPIYFATHLPLPERPAAAVSRVSLTAPPSPATTSASTITAKSPILILAPASAPPPPSHRWNIPLPENFSVGLFGLYAAIVPLLLLRLLVSYVRLRLLRRSTQSAPTELSARLAHWLTRCPTSRPVELRLSQRARSPLAIGFRRPFIVMPADLVLELNRQEYDNLGVHELAHIRRCDDWTNLAQRILQAFLFFHPAAHYIGRKLNLDREMACDDWVVAAHESRSYARCLTKVVELRRYHRGALLLSSGAFFGKGQIVKRVESLLDRTRNSGTTTSSVAVICAVLALVFIASQVVNLPAVVAFTQDETGPMSSSRWKDDSRDLQIKLRGDVTFSDDEQSVASISPDGFLIIDETKGWSHRRLEVRSSSAGAAVAKYFIDSREKPLDGVGRAWAASTYLFALREMGLDSEGRVRRILARRGPAGVIEEVDLIHSDHVKCEYLNHLLDQSTLTPRDLQRVADSARKISSDNDKADFLVAHAADFSHPEVRNSYFSAVNSVSSDNDRRRVLMHLLTTDGHNAETIRLVGLSAKSMNSDNDKADVLLAIPAAASSDARCGLLNAARTIQSDNDKARVLHDTSYVESPSCRDAWFAVANLIHSDNDRSGVLENLLSSPTLQAETYREVANSAKSMNSDNDKANVLVLLGSHYAEVPFFDAVNTIHSDNDRGRILKTLLGQKLAKAELLEVIQSAVGLSDDHEKTEVLLEVAKQAKEAEVIASLKKACEKISSDNDYRRVASALLNGSVSPESSK